MCKYQVGDVVQRTQAPYRQVKIGDRGTVVKVISDALLLVEDSSGDHVNWNTAYCSLYRRDPAALTPVNAHTFKVGDKGQTNVGWGYEIVAEHNDRLVVVGTGENTSYMVDKSGHGLGCPVVLCAPKRTLYGMEVVFSNTRHNAPRAKETRITLYTSDAHRKQDIAGMTGQGVWTIVRQWEEEEA